MQDAKDLSGTTAIKYLALKKTTKRNGKREESNRVNSDAVIECNMLCRMDLKSQNEQRGGREQDMQGERSLCCCCIGKTR